MLSASYFTPSPAYVSIWRGGIVLAFAAPDPLHVWRAAGYVRVSREDGDRPQSETITNQIRQIEDFVASRPDLQLIQIFQDDGFSGVTFDRPGFQALMNSLKTRHTDCIIVKDLSRLGRNYVEAGRYIEDVFPFLGVRFLSIQDAYDSLAPQSAADQLLLPFRNLINDSYARDISQKVRSSKAIRRKQGLFIGPFAPYGYRKDPVCRNHLVPDPATAGIVQQIFLRFLEGHSPRQIAASLNRDGIPSPMAWRQTLGLPCPTGFPTGDVPQWSTSAIFRILSGEVYIGTLVQGKQTTPGHKVRVRISLPPEDWARVEHTHAPLVPPPVFQRVQELLLRDTRARPGQARLEPLSGLLFCADCGSSLVRRSVKSGGRRYHYCICSAHKEDRTRCSRHGVREEDLLCAVNRSMQQILLVQTDEKQLVRLSDSRVLTPHAESPVRDHTLELLLHRKEGLAQMAREGLLSQEELQEYEALYDRRIRAAEATASRQKGTADQSPAETWHTSFPKPSPALPVPRPLLVLLLDRITVREGGHIRLHLRFSG